MTLSVKPENYEAIVAAINAKYEGQLRRGNEIIRLPSISTGSPELDVAMGGGVPQGRFTRFYGNYGCLAPETKILTSTYQWVELGMLADEDGIIGFDEYPPVASRGVQRKLRYSSVIDNPFIVLPSYRIYTDRGTKTVASDNHLWLVSTKKSHYRITEWKTSDKLFPGDHILWFGNPWPELSQAEREMAAWLGGVFDGEGSIDGNRISFHQNAGEVLDRALDYMDKLGFRLVSLRPKDGDKTKCFTARYGGTAYELMKFLAYIPSVRLCLQASWEGREILPKGPHTEKFSGHALVEECEFIGEQELCAIGTSTQTLISDGLYSHNSTKTMTAYSVIAQAQKQGLLCAYYNIERRYEDTFARACGINTKELTLVEGVTIEGIVDKMESLLGVCHLHVLDSCTMADSEDELAADIRDWRPALLARVWGKGFRRINEHFDHLDNTVILIDQMRMKKKGGGRSMELVEDPAGGQVFDFISSMSVHFKVGAWLWRAEEGGFVDSNSAKKLESGKEDSIDKQMQPQGREIKIRVEKSSVCRPFRTATLHYDLDSLQYDRTYEYVKAGLYYNVIHQTSNGRYQYVDGDGEATKMHGMGQLRNFIEEHPEIQEYIHQTALEANFRENDV